MGLCMKLILSYIFSSILIMLLMCIEKETNLKLVEKIFRLNIRFCFDKIKERLLIAYALEVLHYIINCIIFLYGSVSLCHSTLCFSLNFIQTPFS